MRKLFIATVAVAGMYILTKAFKKGIDRVYDIVDPFRNLY